MNEAQQQLADRIGELLAQSPLDDEIKKRLLDKMEDIPEGLLFKLKDALEMEKEELENIAFEIELFFNEQDAHWMNVVGKQKEAADIVMNAWAEKLK